MMITQDAFDRYKAYLEGLTLDQLEDLKDYVTEDVIFRDSLHDVTGCAAMTDIFEQLFATVSEIEFHIDSYAIKGRIVFFRWTLNGILTGKPWTVEGVTRLSFNDQGRITAQLEYWDAASQLYARFPVVGPLLRWLRRRITKV